MKGKKIFRGVLLMLCACCLAFAAAGCTKDTPATFALGDYAVEPVADVSVNVPTTAIVRSFSGKTVVNDSLDPELLILRDNTDYKYAVYNLSSDTTVVSGLNNMPSIIRAATDYGSGYSGSGYYADPLPYVIRINETESAVYYAPDGTRLLSTVRYTPTFEIVYTYDATDKITATYVCVRDYASGSAVDAYFKVGSGRNGYTYTATDAPTQNTTPSYYREDDPYQVGDLAFTTSLGGYSAALENYSIAQFGKIYRFYKDNEPVGTLDLTDCVMLQSVGQYIYYEHKEVIVPSLDTAHKVETEVFYKADRTLYRYDILGNRSEPCITDGWIVDEILPMYSWKTQSYDAAFVVGYKTTDGKVVASDKRMVVYVGDAKLQKQIDVTGCGLDISRALTLYRLADDRFAIGNYIVDGNGTAVMPVAESDVFYHAQKRIRFRASGKYGLKDYDGKVTVSPNYTSIADVYCDGKLLAIRTDDDWDDVLITLDSEGKETVLAHVGAAADGGVVREVAYYDGFYTVRTDDKFTVYNIRGESIRTFEYSSVTPTVRLLGKNYYVQTDETTYYKLR